MRDINIDSVLKKLGICDEKELDTAIYREYGKSAGDRHINEMNRLFDLMEDRIANSDGSIAHLMRQTDMVDYINSDTRLSMLCASFYDHDYIRAITNFYNGHEEFIGEKVLDYGCGNGVITCIAAMIAPHAQFTGIDISPQAIRVACEVRDRLGLDNVSFKCEKGLGFDKYDTMLFSRVLHENIFYTLPGRNSAQDVKTKERNHKRFAKNITTLKNSLTRGGTILAAEYVTYEPVCMEMIRRLETEGIRALFGGSFKVTCRIGDDNTKVMLDVFKYY